MNKGSRGGADWSSPLIAAAAATAVPNQESSASSGSVVNPHGPAAHTEASAPVEQPPTGRPRRVAQAAVILIPSLLVSVGTFVVWGFWPGGGLIGLPLILAGVLWLLAVIAFMKGWVRPAVCPQGHANAVLIRDQLYCRTCLRSGSS